MDNPQSRFSLEVKTSDLTKALKSLRKLEKCASSVSLSFDGTFLVLHMGESSQKIAAWGEWSETVLVRSQWAIAVSEEPVPIAITHLLQEAGRLTVRNYSVDCEVGGQTRLSEPFDADREIRLIQALSILENYNLEREDVEELIDRGCADTASLWGPADGAVLERVCEAWISLGPQGVEPSAIRKVFDKKIKDLWREVGSKDNASDAWKRAIHLTERDLADLATHGDLSKGALVSRLGDSCRRDVVLAWKELAIFGVEPSHIARMLEERRSNRPA